ncbi:MAG: dNTP triphosphohydrolase [Candidatus Omnitrophica bacterium]|nr:dNTP triphosphohydrolase [Candidatus Omnitrophota bacterium]
MGDPDPIRHCRRFDNTSDDKRTRPARDRDRVIFSGAFRRLAGVTQVASPQENHLFHSRLTHSLEVAQIGRRITERLFIPDTSLSGLNPDLAKLKECLDPDVIEAACLIHDLGHPPFGHIGGQELDNLVRSNGNNDGFEANAQSFRIVTRLVVHREGYNGLDLCRATLNAALKYPWKRDFAHLKSKEYLKFGAYTDDEEYFDWTRKYSAEKESCLEANIMDFSDDIANAVHDIIDFHRAGLLPLASLYYDRDVFMRMRNAATTKIHQYDYNAKIEFKNGKFLFTPDEDDIIEISFLKRVFFDFLISNPRLTTQQYGQREIISSLFNTYFDAAGITDNNYIIPDRFRHLFEALGTSPTKSEKARLAADIVSSFTDSQAYSMFGRLNGYKPGEISDIVVW